MNTARWPSYLLPLLLNGLHADTLQLERHQRQPGSCALDNRWLVTSALLTACQMLLQVQPKPNNIQVDMKAFPPIDRHLECEWMDRLLSNEMTQRADSLSPDILTYLVGYCMNRGRWTEATTLTIKGLASAYPDPGAHKLAYDKLVDRATSQLPGASDVQLLLTSLKELHVLWALFLRWNCIL